MVPVVKPTTNGKLQTTTVAGSYLSASYAEKEEMPPAEMTFLEKRDTPGS